MATSVQNRSAGQRAAALALVVGTLCWGCGFTWAKVGGQSIHQTLGLPQGSPFGPIFLLGWRFLLGGVIWTLLFPGARRGWSIRSVGHCFVLGGLCGAGLIVQHLGLDRTSAAVSAFLTSLTILFVPILMTVALRRSPRPMLWIGALLATVGIWMMTGATPSGFGLGEILGLLCAVAFSFYILAVNAILPAESPWRMTGGQFLVVAIICFSTCAVLRPDFLRPRVILHVLRVQDVWLNLLLLTTFTTLTAFGLLTHFQPRLDATRAALIYLLEPIFAAIYAAFAMHALPSPLAMFGAALILIANVLVELILCEWTDKAGFGCILVEAAGGRCGVMTYSDRRGRAED